MNKPKPNWCPSTLHVLVIGLAVVVVLLTQKSHLLEKNLLVASSAIADGVEIGDRVPVLPATEIDGGETLLRFDDDDRETVLLVFDTSCPGCTKNLAPWLELYRQHDDEYRFVAISLDDVATTRRYAERNELPYPVVVADRRFFSRMYGIVGVPTTLVINRTGRVIDVQTGRPVDGFLADT